MHEYSWIYCTTKDVEEAKKLGSLLVRESLAACVNILPQITSIYEWEGALQEECECAFVAKTTKAREKQLIEHLTTLHSYDCPCIISIPIRGGNPEFLGWVDQKTSDFAHDK